MRDHAPFAAGGAVNTVPEKTPRSFAESGAVEDLLGTDTAEADAVFEAVGKASIDVDAQGHAGGLMVRKDSEPCSSELIGLGRMGANMAKRLMRGGPALVVRRGGPRPPIITSHSQIPPAANL
jgi:hypothetical protein